MYNAIDVSWRFFVPYRHGSITHHSQPFWFQTLVFAAAHLRLEHICSCTLCEAAGMAMLSIEGDWVDGALASQPVTSSGCKIQWQVFDSTKFGCEVWLDIKPSDNVKTEMMFVATTQEPFRLHEDGCFWTIDFVEMIQRNDEHGTKRALRRIVIVAAGGPAK